MIWTGIALMGCMVIGYMIGLSVAEGRANLEKIHRQIEIQSALRNRRTDVVDRAYWFNRNDGYEVFRVNQN